MKNLLEFEIVLPKLINGKVCTIEKGYYTLHRVGTYCDIADGFDPGDYAIHDKYKCIVKSKPADKERALVQRDYQEYLESINHK